jgi:hypothetical protein
MFGCSGNIQDLMWCQSCLFVDLNTVQPGIADSAETALEAALVDRIALVALVAHKSADQTGVYFQVRS